MKKEDVFGAYDIRGTYPDQVNEQLFYDIGRAFVRWRKTKKVYVGRDIRPHSGVLRKALTEGLRAQGAAVIDLGLISTPMAYLASRKGDVLMITASHNPMHYNGIKAVLKGTQFLTGRQLLKLKPLLGKHTAAHRGKLIKKTILRSYLRTILAHAHNINKTNVVFAGGNCTATITIPKLLDHLPVDATFIGFNRHEFTHHEQQPDLLLNAKDCADMVKLKKAKLGVAFDGDMDRIAFIDDHGRIVPADIMLALFASYELKTHPKRTIVADLRSSRSLKNAILAAGGQLVLSKVGTSATTAKMKRHRAILGGELSGHFYFKDYFGVESADLALVKLLTILSHTNLPLSALIAPYFQYENSGELSFKVADKTRTLSAIKKAFIDGRISRTDGLTIEYPDAWFNVRASNTEPVLRLVIEASTKERLEEIKAKLLKFLK
ncbi:MAG: phosphomannomutase/phosphoglucomutase [Nanoarchaeota archaeon]